MATRKNTSAPAPTFAVEALPTTAVQYRNASGGTGTEASNAYKAATRGLAKWAKANEQSATVHALVHLGWCAGAGARAACQSSNSVAYKQAAPLLKVGEAAGPQVVALLTTLVEAGAPEAMTATVWSTFTGQASA